MYSIHAWQLSLDVAIERNASLYSTPSCVRRRRYIPVDVFIEGNGSYIIHRMSINEEGGFDAI